ncbi:MAG: phosphate ABC transporter permease PstA [Dissulfurimicrobium sp.]|uniref:phosphate ABC transporter permease PstA n=1 Tax=Dissulfurimicrobium sp. TaxID=2022436 RepID=UPI00404B20B5
MKKRYIGPRKFANYAALVVSLFSALVGIFFLVWILFEILVRGFSAINWAFFTQLPLPPGETGGGLANAMVGTLIITALAMIMGVPLGVLAGTYLSEFGDGRLARLIRFLSNIFGSAPAIVIGIFVYAIVVVPMRNFSGLAGAISLAIIMIPIITRTTEEMLKLVPVGLREAALALGAPYWHIVVQVVYRQARAGILTGIILAVARVSGETAALLFTALNSPYWPSGILQPMPNLTVTIFNYAMSPYDDWQIKAWGASFVIAFSVLLMNIIARLLIHRIDK